ncbi:phage head closure protein [Paraburkholderia sp. SIMBA_049]
MTGSTVRAGALDRQVSIQQRTLSQDSFGQQLQVWSEIKKVYAGIEALSGGERLAAQSLASEVTHRFTVRYDAIFADPKVVAAYRIVYNSRIFDVQDCENIDESNRLIQLMASEGLTLG